MALNKFFRFPFAVTGDKAAIPDDTQPSGDVSFEQGYGPDYARDTATDPLAKNIERDRMNQLFFDVTTALREYQIMGTPDFITSAQNGGTAFSYSKFARVRYDDGTGFKIYESKIDMNTNLPTVSASWVQVSSFNFASFLATQAEAVAGTDNTKYMSPLRVSQAVPSATVSTAGRLRIATDAEVQTGTNTTKAITPAGLSSRTATESRTGVVELATDAEAQAFAANKIIDGAKLAAALKGSNQSFSAASGYQMLPGGFILQWGYVLLTGAASGTVTVTYPIAFPNNMAYASATDSSNASNKTVFGVADKQAESCVFSYYRVQGTATSSFYWFAIGY